MFVGIAHMLISYNGAIDRLNFWNSSLSNFLQFSLVS